MILVITLSSCLSFNLSCETIILNLATEYKLSNDMTNFEMFSQFDCNEDKCIDENEINSLMKKIGVPWHCRWPKKVIEYYIDDKKGKECISWNDFKRNLNNIY